MIFMEQANNSLLFLKRIIPLAKKEFDIIELLSQHNIAGNDQCTARSVNDMKRLVKTGVFMMLVLMILASQKNVAEAKAKVIHKKMTIDLNMDFSSFRYIPTKLQKYSKVKVCVKNRKVLKAKAKGRKYIVMK